MTVWRRIGCSIAEGAFHWFWGGMGMCVFVHETTKQLTEVAEVADRMCW